MCIFEGSRWSLCTKAGMPLERGAISNAWCAAWTREDTTCSPSPRQMILNWHITICGGSGPKCPKPVILPSLIGRGTDAFWSSAWRDLRQNRNGNARTAKSTKWKNRWQITALYYSNSGSISTKTNNWNAFKTAKKYRPNSGKLQMKTGAIERNGTSIAPLWMRCCIARTQTTRHGPL